VRQKIIAVSACLLGHKVRYDGAHQIQPLIISSLAEEFKLLAVCPEMEIGLGVPRAKIELLKKAQQTRVLSTQEPIVDLTQTLQNFAEEFLNSANISGFILKDKSPSCGVGNCKIKDLDGQIQTNGTGIFAASILQLKPNMPLLQSDKVTGKQAFQSFIKQVRVYDD